jgi:hypothetical protein
MSQLPLSQENKVDISVILTPQIGHIDPPGERDSKNAVA